MKLDYLKTAILLATGFAIHSTAWGYRGGDHWNRGGTSIGVHIGVPLFVSPFYGYQRPGIGFYGYPYSEVVPATMIVTTPPEPVVYVEKSEQPSEGFWHYCFNPAGYYPQVQHCAGNWQKIPPRLDSK